MLVFEYRALNSNGKSQKGLLEADSARQVRQRLKEQGLLPIEVSESKESKPAEGYRRSIIQRGIKTSELALFTRQLSTLIHASIPLEECLKAVAEQTEKNRIQNIIMGVRAKVVEGYPLVDGMREFPHIFDRLFCSMVSAGENSGHLDKVLSRLANYVENKQKVHSKLQQALIYPTVLSLFAVAIVSFLLASVVPKIVDQFVQMGQALPAMTQLLLSISSFVQQWGIYIVLIVILGQVCLAILLKRVRFRLFWDRNLFTLPLVGKLVRGIETSRFARTLSICTSSSIPLLDGVKVATEVVSNQFAAQRLVVATEKIREGISLTNALQQTQLFPPMMMHMIASGEQSGELEQMLNRAADNQELEFESSISIALGLFTPAVIAIMAGVVLFIVMAILMPILEMNNLVVG